jgi:hypothetical protein
MAVFFPLFSPMTKILSSGIPQRIVRDAQAFQLVAIVEGAAANTQFINNLQVVGQQRRALADLRAKVDSLPKSATSEERSSLQTQINQLDARLTSNMAFMSKNYGYSVKHNYLLLPVYSALLKKAVNGAGAPIDDESKATLVAEFHTSDSYDQLQALRQRAAILASDANKKAEFEAVKAELSDKYAFDLNSHYILQVRKGALYATVSA